MAKYYAINGLKLTEIDADGLILKTDDGQEVELFYRKSDKIVSISTKGQMVVEPRASNLVYIRSFND